MLAGLAVRCVDLRHVYVLDQEESVALHGVAMAVSPGESVAVLGPSGSGKSTLMVLLAGLRRPTAGRLYIGGDDVTTLTERELLRLRSQHIGVVVQNPSRNLLPYGSAEDNVAFAQRGAPRSRRGHLPDPRALLKQLDLARLADQRVSRMSGGEQQRLAVAVGMAVAPGLLLADEPTSQLDRTNRDLVVDLLQRISSQFGTTVVAVTHDPEVAAAAGRTMTIVDGRLDDRDQHRRQFTVVGEDGAIVLPEDVDLPPGTRLRLVRKATGVELVRDVGGGVT